ncbi:MAG TPA: GGDEF domain-containing protein [Solirubrobacterales bacterium]|nr:GGDEF domain-containing protein [Solirubrobacterales bacterium]
MAATRRSGLRGALSATIALVLFGGAVLVALHDWALVGGSELDHAVNGPLYDAVIFAAGLAALLKADAERGERSAWLLIGAALLAWAAGEIYWTAELEGDASVPILSAADTAYLAYYPLAAAGLLQLVRTHRSRLDWRLWTDALIAALGTAALGTAAIFSFVADRTSGTLLERATVLAYPLGDILMLSLVVGVIALTGWRPGRTWTLLLLGLAALAAADVSYTLVENGAALPGGNWIEPLYLLGAVAIGAVAWQAPARQIRGDTGVEGWRRLIVPGFFAAVMIVLFAIQYATTGNLLTVALTAATVLAIIARLAVSVRENERLLEEVQTDYLTGLGNQPRFQRDLATRCRRAAEEPLTLLLLDLNGFKRYNDTFGHPAGDAMLTRLGAQLRTAVADERTTAYRIGGDEFAVLNVGPGSALPALVDAATSALTASGPGYALSAACGSVRVPLEASDPVEILQLADVRMYAQKESRSTSADRLEADSSPRPLPDRESVEQGP